MGHMTLPRPYRNGLSSVGCNLHIEPVYVDLYIKFEIFAITNYEDA